MKSKILYTAIAALLATSCALDETPLEQMDPRQAFSDSLRTEMFVNELYRLTNGGENMTFNRLGGTGSYGGAIIDCVTDIAVYAPIGVTASVNLFVLGNINSANNGNPDACWAQSYEAIRKANIILEYIDYCRNMSAERRNQFIGEAKLLKASFFFDLVKRYGGMPIVDEILSIEGQINRPRDRFEDCIDYMVRLCDEAAPLLPTRYPSNAYGRVTRGAALGLKASVLLFAASPLFNENPVPNSTEVHRYASYDMERWGAAADAALACIELRNPDMTFAHDLYPDYQRLFFDRLGNNETMIARLREPWPNAARANCPIGYGGGNPGRCNTNVSMELIDMFETKNGLLPAADPTFDPQHPNDNRDDRFYASILFSGVHLWGREVEFWGPTPAGRDYRNASLQGCYTGYTMYKFIDPEMSLVEPVKNADNIYHFLRFAEVLLTYAEAKNEYLGAGDASICNDAMIYTCLNRLRTRAGLPLLATGSLDKGEMREYVRRERTVELAFEEHRYYDLRRWRLAETRLNAPVHGVEVTNVDGNVVYGQRFVVENRVFPLKQYYHPIPQTELDKNPMLVKNPNW
jgi:hypothetical protein